MQTIKKTTINIGIIGAGSGGTELINILHRYQPVTISIVSDRDKDAPGILLARRLKIPTTTDYKKIKKSDIDILIDVTGDSNVAKDMLEFRRSGIEVIGGESAKFIWQLIEEQTANREEIERLLFEYQSLYDIALKLTSSEDLDRLCNIIVEYATLLTNTPAGSLVMFDEKAGEMSLVASKGFSKNFQRRMRWKLRRTGLTSNILNQTNPLVIFDVNSYPNFDNPVMIKEGVASLMAVPLISEGKIMGILYVDDFKPRNFTPRETSILSLLSKIAALVIEKTRLFEKARLMAITDELTGLYNHRHFLQQLTLEIDRTKRYERPLSFLMVDIDHFKHYNDTNGHLVGNELLREFGHILHDYCRSADIVARYGGEEFAIIMPETDQKKGKRMAERLRKIVEGYKFEAREKQPNGKLTISIGFSSYPNNASTSFELIEKADKALYRAKEGGRNRVCISNEKPR
ncbi:MAG: diguanylate cyclase [Nitrospirota bacterium]